MTSRCTEGLPGARRREASKITAASLLTVTDDSTMELQKLREELGELSEGIQAPFHVPDKGILCV